MKDQISPEVQKLVRGLQMEHYDLLHKYKYADFKLDEEPAKGYEKEAEWLTGVYEQAISSLINKGRIEARLDELRHVFVSMDDALGSELAEPVAWEYGTVEDRIAQLSALETPTPPSPDSKEES